MANLLPNNVPNLQQSSAIVSSQGLPNPEFVRWLNDNFTNVITAINFINDQQLQLQDIVDQIILLIDAQNATTDELATKAPIDSPTFTGTVSGITKSMVGLGNVDNTSDINKPVSTAQQAALDTKLDLAGGDMTGTLQMNGSTVISSSRHIYLRGYTVSGLPTPGTQGRLAYVTDALAPTFLTPVVGGGAIVTPVFDDGTNWVAH